MGRSGALPSLAYYRRIFSNYVLRRHSHLGFWHETPELNAKATYQSLGPFYMTFHDKASYPGPFDSGGVPMLNYGGKVGLHYNPIAVAQYGLAHYNLLTETNDSRHRDVFLCQADWLVDNLELNDQGVSVWRHHFDWEYRGGLHAPWPSGLAQGASLSCLARAATVSKDIRYRASLEKGFEAFLIPVEKGGICVYGPGREVWIEEYIVDPPSHIINGFLWGLWGVWDYFLLTGDERARALFQQCVDTVKQNLHRYDTGWWSLYEVSPYRLKDVASSFYHKLHIVQMHVMHNLTGDAVFRDFAQKWEGYQRSRLKRLRSRAYKAAFKLLHY